MLARCLRSSAAQTYGKPLVMNVSLPIAAVLLDLGFAAAAVKSIPILARTAGLLAHLAEEQGESVGFVMARGAEESVVYERSEEDGLI
jgi:citrate synthase